MNYQLILLFLCFFVCNCFSQDEEFQLKGQILEFEQPIEGAHVYNSTTFQGASTTIEGIFDINAKLRDTLVISHVNYFSLKVVINEALLKRNPLIIYLYEKTNQLDTVTIKSHDLTQNLKLDSGSRPRERNTDSIIADFQKFATMPMVDDYNSSRDIPPKVMVDPTQGTGVGGSASIGFKFKDVELRKSLRIKRDFPTKLIDEFGIKYFTETLKIPKNKVYHFITYCEVRKILELYQNNQLMKVLTILQEESKVYLKIDD